MTQQINLFNPLFLRQEKYLSARTMAQALGLVLVGLGAFYAYAVWQTRGLKDLVARQERNVAAERARVIALGGGAGEGRLQALQNDAQRLEAEIRSRRALFEKLRSGAVGSEQGFSPFLAALSRRTIPGVWLTGLTLADGGEDLYISGRVLEPELLPAYLRALNSEEVMRGRKVVSLRLTSSSLAPAAPAQAATGPARFVEFSLSAPRRAPEPKALPAREAGR